MSGADPRPEGLVVHVELAAAPEPDPEADETLALRLRREALESGADDVERTHGEAPAGAKALEGVLAALAVKVAPGAVGAVLDGIRSVLARSGGRRVKIRLGDDEIEIEGASTDAERRLIEAFVARHTAASPAGPS